MRASVDGGGRKKRKPDKPVSWIDDSPEVSARWRWHYRTLALLRDRLIDERVGRLTEAKVVMEPHSLHAADSATDEFDHGAAMSRLSVTQDALYEVEAAMRRIRDGTYGRCERTGKRINAARLRAVPWTRLCVKVEEEIEKEAGRASGKEDSVRTRERAP